MRRRRRRVGPKRAVRGVDATNLFLLCAMNKPKNRARGRTTVVYVCDENRRNPSERKLDLYHIVPGAVSALAEGASGEVDLYVHVRCAARVESSSISRWSFPQTKL